MTFAAPNNMQVMMDTRALEASRPRHYSGWGKRVGQRVGQLGLTLATAESCTGGTIASMIAEVAGSSAYFKGSVVSYAVEVKERVLGVDVSAGVVSESTARQMAEGVARVLRTDCAVATTGVAGPTGGSTESPVGTVWIAATRSGKTVAQCFHFVGDREAVILQASDAALRLLWQLLDNETEKTF
jgi:PncC family amidohydrolase